MAIVISGTTGIDAGSLPVANTGKISAGTGLSAILNTAGVDRVTVDTSGNVGIGTSSPISKLSISGYLNSQDSNNNGALYLGQYLNGNGAYGGFEWNNTAGILGLRTQGAYPITFATNNTERMRIDANGNVGIGMSSPSAKLDVALPAMTSASSNNVIVIRSPADGVNNSLNGTLGICFNARYQYITPEYSGAGIYAINTDNNAYGRSLGLLFKTSTQDSIATEKMRIDSNGYVTTPNQPSFRSYASTYNGSTGIYYNWATTNGQGSTYTYYRNVGNCFNTSTGTFTAPIAGRYLITAMYDNSTGAVERNIGWLYYNGSNIGEWVESYGLYDNSTGSLVLYLNATDTIQFATHPTIPYSSIVAGIDLLG